MTFKTKVGRITKYRRGGIKRRKWRTRKGDDDDDDDNNEVE